ncbi:hypothetical protein [Rhizohabitans arisaemae]|uniref:hypothetical protein n=1 Tax=Rhizohabitans arisaemae TaxID=2720610 RepID=UPI0024B07C72|nr:hypothetical protein [Rhizohabitans arisaemae]
MPDALPYRLLLLTVFAGFLLLILIWNDELRGLEAVIASDVVAVFASTETGYSASRAIVTFDNHTAVPMGLRITPECTSAFLVLPLLLISGLVVWLQRKVSLWPLLALVTATLLMLATNQVRILTVTLLIKGLGFDPGYYWGHTVVGSVISVLGIAASLVAYVLLIMRRAR